MRGNVKRVAVLLALWGCDAAPPPPEPPRGTPSPEAGPDPDAAPDAPLVQVVTRRVMDGDTTQTVVSPRDDAVVVKVRWPAVGRPRRGDRQTVVFVAPNGAVYDQRTGPVDEAGLRDAVLAVGGTHIQEFNLYGTWTARIHLNDSPKPSRQVTFEIAP